MNICFIGNSVSSQKHSYQKILSQRMGELSVNTPEKNKVINCSLGGIGSLGISFFIDRFIKKTPIDLCFIETFVADLGLATPKKYIAAALKGIMQNKALAHAKIVPLYLYRSHISVVEYQDLLNIYDEVFDSFGLTPINVYAHISDLVANQKIDSTEVVYDQVHTTEKGSEIYANFIYEALLEFEEYKESKELNEYKKLHVIDELKKTKATKTTEAITVTKATSTPLNPEIKTLALPPHFNHSHAFIPKSLGPASEYVMKGRYHEGRFRLIMPYYQIESDTAIEFAMGAFNCIGLIVIADADTGAIMIANAKEQSMPIDRNAEANEWCFSVQIYDRWCDSSRLQVVIFPEPAVAHSTLTIMALDHGKADYTANLLTNQTMHVAKNIKIVHLMAYEHHLTGIQPE